MKNYVKYEGLPRVCDACGMQRTQGPDPCLGYLPGLAHACCGHGQLSEAYATVGGEPNQLAGTITNAATLRGQDALDLFGVLKRPGVKHLPSGPIHVP